MGIHCLATVQRPICIKLKYLHLTTRISSILIALSQIILKFDGNVADTSQEEDDNNKNIFVMNLNGYEVCREQIPAVNAGIAYNIYPHKGINNYFSSIAYV